MDLEEKFRHIQEIKQRSYGKLVQMQRRLFDEWALDKFAENGYPDFKMAYLPILMNIGPEGIGNNELAEKGHVTKQATSKVIRELEKAGLVAIVMHEGDARRSHIRLTTKGKELVIHAVEEVFKRMAIYEELVGRDEFRQAMDVMYKILDYERECRERKKLKSKK